MAERINFTTLVDLSLEPGQVHVEKLRKELPKTLEQALGNLPGGSLVVNPTIEVDPKLNAGQLRQALDKLVSSDAFKNAKITPAFEALEKDIAKTGRALEHIEALTTKFRPNADMLDYIGKLKAGEEKLENTLSTMSKRERESFIKQLDHHRAYYNEVNKIWTQIGNQFSNINDSLLSPRAKTELDNRNKAIDRLSANYREAEKALASLKKEEERNVASGRDTGANAAELDKARKEVARLRKELVAAKAERSDFIKTQGGEKLGASVVPVVSEIQKNVRDLIGAIDRSVKAFDKSIDQQQKAAEVAERNQRSLESYLGKGKQLSPTKAAKLTDQELADLRRDAILERNRVKGEVLGAGGIYRDDPTYKKLGRILSDIGNEQERRATESQVSKKEQQVSYNRAQLDAILGRLTAGGLTQEQALREASISTLRSLEASITASQNSLRALIKDPRASLSFDDPRYQQLESEKRTLQAELKRRTASAATSTKTPEQEQRDLARQQAEQERIALRSELLDRGRAVFTQYRSNLYKTPSEDVEAARAFAAAEERRLRLEAADARSTHGARSAEYKRAAKAAGEMSEAVYQLGHAGKFTHPILHQLGALLRQFTRYALGYGALYEFTRGLRAMGAAAIDLDDNLKNIQAITGTTETEITGLSESIKRTAETTAFDLNDISKAVQVLAQAGVDLKDIPQTTQAVANLATATTTQLTTAADIITTVKSVWDDVSVETIADRVTQAANVSKLAVEDLKTILSLGSSFAKEANVNLDQFLGLVATLRNAGVRGSTVGTGSRQLLLELFAPDAKFSEFLSRQYQTVGEDINPEQAKQRFQAFKLEDNPLLVALNELRRIGADTFAGSSDLQRAIDRRAYNALAPLLRNLDRLPELTGQLSSAPTARQAAQIALDSLKKSADNLADSFKSFASTVSEDVIPGLADGMSNLADTVHSLDRAVSAAQRTTTGTNTGFALTTAAAAAAYGYQSSRGLRGVLKGAAYGTAAGIGAFGLDVAAKNSLGEDGSRLANNVEDVVKTLEIGALFLGALKIVAGALKKKFPAVAKEAAEAATKSVLSGLRGLFKGSGFLSFIPRLSTGPLGVIIGAGLYELAQLALEKVFGIAKANVSNQARNLELKRFLDLQEKQAEQEADAQFSQQDIAPFLPPRDGQQADPSSFYGKTESLKQGISDLRSQVSEAIGVALTDDMDSLMFEVLSNLRKYGATKGFDRTKYAKELVDRLGGTGTLGEREIQGLVNTSGELSSRIAGLGRSLSDTFQQLGQNPPKAGSVDEAKLEALSSLSRLDAAYRDLLITGTGSANTIIGAVDAYRSKVLEASKAADDDKERTINALTESIDLLAQSETNVAIDVQLTTLLDKLHAARERFGDTIEDLLIRDLQSRIDHATRAEESRQNVKVTTGFLGPVQTPVIPYSGPSSEALQQTQNLLVPEVTAQRANRFEQDARSLEALLEKLKAAEEAAGKEKDQVVADKIKASIGLLAPELERLRSGRLEASGLLRSEGYTDAARDAGSRSTQIENRLIEQGLLARESNGQFDFGERVGNVPRYLDLTEQRNRPLTGPFRSSEQYLQNLQRIFEAKNLQEELARTDPSRLISSDASNPLNVSYEAQKSNLEEERRYLDKKAYTTELEKKQALQENQQKLDALDLERRRTNRNLTRQESARAGRIQLTGLQGDISESQRQRATALERGDISAFDEAQGRLASLFQQRYEAQQQITRATVQEADLSEAMLGLYNQRVDEEKQFSKDWRETRKQLLAKQLGLQGQQLGFSLDTTQQARQSYIDTGNVEGVQQTNESLLVLLQQKYELEVEAVKLTSKGVDRQKDLERLENDLVKRTREILDSRALLQAVQERTARALAIPAGPVGVTPAEASRISAEREQRGEAIPLSEQEDKVRRDLGTLEESRDAIELIIKGLTSKIQSTSIGDEERANYDNQLAKANTALKENEAQIGTTTQRLKEFGTTLTDQVSQISASSIAAKIQELPSSLKYLSRNIEQRFVDAVDSFGSALAGTVTDLITDFVGLGNSSREVSQKLNDLLDAQANYSLIVQQGSLATAEQISVIRQNETDPARQEYLIQRALEAQKQSEVIAAQQVSEAERQLADEEDTQSFAARFGAVGLDLFNGILTDAIKGQTSNFFSGLFGLGSDSDGLGTAPTGEWSNPFYVKVLNGLGLPAGETPDQSGLTGSIKDFLSFDSSESDPAGKIADSADQLSETVQDDSLFGGLFDGISTSFSELTSGLSGAFSSLTGQLGALFGIREAESRKVSTLDQVRKWVGLASSAVGVAGSVGGSLGNIGSLASSVGNAAGAAGGAVEGVSNFTWQDWQNGLNFSASDVGFSRGGFVTGPGTTTSDSVPARLSRGEYVLSANAVGKIGRDTLDAWNFHAARPMSFASGGMVPKLSDRDGSQRTTQSSQNPQSEQGVRVVLVDDNRQVKNYITSSEGEKTLVDFVRRNSLSLKQYLR